MKTLFNIFFLTMLTLGSFAQNVGVNSTGVAPDNSAMLDVVSADKGMLVPRVNIIDVNTAAPVTAPANSLLVYNTNVTSGVGYYFWDGTKWTKLADANSNSDEDWYEVGGTLAPDDINDNIFTQGNVGIGTLTPNAPLDLGNLKLDKGNGNVAVASDVFMEGQGLIASENNMFINIDSDNDGAGDLFLTKGTETSAATKLVTLLNNGNMGVGRTNPQIKFVVSEGNSANTSVALEGFNSGYAGFPTILPAGGSHFGGIVHGGTNGQLVLGIRENDVNDGLLIASGGGDFNSDNTYDKAILFARNNGDVGISTVTPDERLHINGNLAIDSYQLGAGNGIFFRDGFNSGSNRYNLSITSDSFDGGTTPDALSINGFEGVSISTGHNTTIQRRLTVVNNGNVGINTTTPTQKLDVTGGAIIRSANTSYFWTERADSDFDIIQSATSSKRAFSIHPSTTGSDVLAVYAYNGAFIPGLHVKNTTGNVGIGTLTPGHKLHVVGNIFASGTITSSDARYKEEIKELESSSELIDKLNPVSYHFKEEFIEKGQFDDKLHFGLIAQDLEKVLPDLVYEDNEGFKAVNYTEIIALLIKSNQELQSVNKNLNKRLENLEKVIK